jgi:hypothetical protein
MHETIEDQDLRDIQAIEKLIARYCEVVDAAVKDADEGARQMQSIFADDAVADYGKGPIEGRKAVIDFLAHGICTTRDWLWHAVHTPNITVQRDHATGSWTVIAMMREKGATAIGTVVGRYHNEFIRTPEGWRMSVMRWVGEATL